MRYLSRRRLQILLDRLFPWRKPKALSQTGALCWRETDGRKEILLITSRASGRWIIPKGWPMEGKTLAEAAAQEAWEEAGVRGTTSPLPVGSYRYSKRAGQGSAVEIDVTVFSLQVLQEQDDYPERGQREKIWAPAEDAAGLVSNSSLCALIRACV